MQFGALGDIHGDFDSARIIISRHPQNPFWVCVGDVANAAGDYESLGAPVYWIKGNNENFDAIAAGRLPADLHFIPNAAFITVQGIHIAGLGGTFAPTWYETLASELPYPARPGAVRDDASAGAASSRVQVRDDKRRHFVREEVDACKAMRGVDLFLSHEAPRPYYVGSQGSGRRGMDAGKTPINEVLAAMQPRLHLFGHHHKFTEQQRQGVQSVGLDVVSHSYLLISGETLEYERLVV